MAKAFKDLLAEALDFRGVNQKWLSVETESTEATISRYVSGVHQPNVEMVARIAIALNIQADFLLGISPSILPDEKFSAEEHMLISCYRNASIADREVLWTLLKRYASETELEFLDAPREASESGRVPA